MIKDNNKLLKTENLTDRIYAGNGQKYTGSNWTRTGVKNWPMGVSPDLMGAYLSKGSWNRHNAALNSWTTYINHVGKLYKWPFEIEILRGYAVWAINVKKLQPNTVRVYLSDLKLAHELRSKNTDAFNDFFLKKMLIGADHLKMYTDIKNKAKLVMTLQMVRILGHKIAKSDWTAEKKRVFWGASCLAYFGSFRLGEIVAKTKGGEFENLKWGDVQFRKDGSALLNIRFPKIIKNTKGDFVDIFEIVNKDYCPIRCLKALKKYSSKENMKDKNVFSFSDGTCLTSSQFTAEIKTLLSEVFGPAISNLSGHSFRAGIPSALCNRPDIASEDDVKCWGRWSSESYRLYTRLKLSARRKIFNKIMCAIL